MEAEGGLPYLWTIVYSYILLGRLLLAKMTNPRPVLELQITPAADTTIDTLSATILSSSAMHRSFLPAF